MLIIFGGWFSDKSPVTTRSSPSPPASPEDGPPSMTLEPVSLALESSKEKPAPAARRAPRGEEHTGHDGPAAAPHAAGHPGAGGPVSGAGHVRHHQESEGSADRQQLG